VRWAQTLGVQHPLGSPARPPVHSYPFTACHHVLSLSGSTSAVEVPTLHPSAVTGLEAAKPGQQPQPTAPLDRNVKRCNEIRLRRARPVSVCSFKPLHRNGLGSSTHGRHRARHAVRATRRSARAGPQAVPRPWKLPVVLASAVLAYLPVRSAAGSTSILEQPHPVVLEPSGYDLMEQPNISRRPPTLQERSVGSGRRRQLREYG